MECSYQTVFAWKSHGEQRFGPCPEKWYPLLSFKKPDLTLLSKCVLHIDTKENQTSYREVGKICSNMLNVKVNTTAGMYSPYDREEFKDFRELSSKLKLKGTIDIFLQEKIPIDHAGNDRRMVLETFKEAINAAPDRSCMFLDEQVKHFDKLSIRTL
ncbi:unnamed protein product [Thelazia callipaeda]|uniref:Reverse transcriptase domain-containing protein n=1 Tax=Thelazia callipaeda TaxID=103827 RepID=A0A0N5DC65_THECL|nr:unnamed protein product [Thelazia callipaeda]